MSSTTLSHQSKSPPVLVTTVSQLLTLVLPVASALVDFRLTLAIHPTVQTITPDFLPVRGNRAPVRHSGDLHRERVRTSSWSWSVLS
jgi:hypothetical protein